MQTSRGHEGEGEVGRAGGGRDLAPRHRITENRDRHRDDWLHHKFRGRHSMSPPMQGRARRCPPYRERRRNYASTSSKDFDDNDGQHYHLHPVLAVDNQDGGRNGGYGSIQQKHIMSDAQLDKRFDKLRAIRNRGLHHMSDLPTSSYQEGLGRKEILVRNSMYLDGGSVNTFTWSLAPVAHSLHAANVVSTELGEFHGGGSTSSSGIYGDDDVQYYDDVRGRYKEGQKSKMYTREAPYTAISLLHHRNLDGASPSDLMKDDNILHSYQESIQLSPEACGRSRNVGNLRKDPFALDEYGPRQLFNLVKHQALSPLTNDDSNDFIDSDIEWTRRVDNRFSTLNDINKQVTRRYREDDWDIMHHRFMDPPKDIVERLEASHEIARTSLEMGPINDYHNIGNVQVEYISGRGPPEFRSRTPQGHEFALNGGIYDYLRDDDLDDYRGKCRRSPPPLSDQVVYVYRGDISPPQRTVREKLPLCEPQYDWLLSTKRYIIDDQVDRVDPRNLFPSTKSRNIVESLAGNKPWTSKARTCLAFPRRHGFGCSELETLPHRLSVSDGRFPFHEFEGCEYINAKKRLKTFPSDFHGYTQPNKRCDFYSSHRFSKNSVEDQHGITNAHDEEDMPVNTFENSEDFKQQIHKAFLHFCKFLNENAHQQKKYLEQGKAGTLLCCACGSLSKEFVDTHSLIMHAHNCLKTRLRAEHLGLHKALCVLMGWNWLIVPDNAKLYQSSSNTEAKALKQDLILWPPLVIVHNSSIGSKNITVGLKITNKEGIEEILRGIGFGGGKTRICQGKQADQSVTLVKFLPTFSGLQEAEKLHKHYVDNNRGKKEFQEMSSLSSSTSCRMEDQVEQLLYGYMGTVEDMDYLDPETRKRCVVKSRKDIEAIAEASLTAQ